MRFVPLLRNVALSRFGRFPLRPIPTCADSRLGQIIYSHLGRVPLRPIPTQGRFPASARSRAVRVIVALLHGGNGRVACLSVCLSVSSFVCLFVCLLVCLFPPPVQRRGRQRAALAVEAHLERVRVRPVLPRAVRLDDPPASAHSTM